LIKKLNKDTRKEMHVTDIITKIKNNQTKWRGHVQRMEDQQMLKPFSNIMQQLKEIQEDHRNDGKMNF
jgi:hypothetical protein